jgi:hypothetical protein
MLSPAACQHARRLLAWPVQTLSQHSDVPAAGIEAFEAGGALPQDALDRLVEAFRRYAVVVDAEAARRVRVRLSGSGIDEGWRQFFIEDAPDSWKNEASRLARIHNLWDWRVEFDV